MIEGVVLRDKLAEQGLDPHQRRANVNHRLSGERSLFLQLDETALESETELVGGLDSGIVGLLGNEARGDQEPKETAHNRREGREYDGEVGDSIEHWGNSGSGRFASAKITGDLARGRQSEFRADAVRLGE